MKIKDLIAVVLIIGGFVGLIASVIAASVFYFQNPDMTELRRFMEYPTPTIWGIVCFIAVEVGLYLCKRGH